MTSDDATLWYDSLINKLAEKYNATGPELATPQQERAEENSETEETPTEEECS